MGIGVGHVCNTLKVYDNFSCIHVINFKEASGRFFFHFLEDFEKCIEYIRIFFIHSFQGDLKILV